MIVPAGANPLRGADIIFAPTCCWYVMSYVACLLICYESFIAWILPDLSKTYSLRPIIGCKLHKVCFGLQKCCQNSEVRISFWSDSICVSVWTLQNVQLRIAPMGLKHGSDPAKSGISWMHLRVARWVVEIDVKSGGESQSVWGKLKHFENVHIKLWKQFRFIITVNVKIKKWQACVQWT